MVNSYVYLGDPPGEKMLGGCCCMLKLLYCHALVSKNNWIIEYYHVLKLFKFSVGSEYTMHKAKFKSLLYNKVIDIP